MLVGNVREGARRPLYEEDAVEVQERVRQRHRPHGPADLEVKLAPCLTGRQVLDPLGGLEQHSGFRVDLAPDRRRSSASFSPRWMAAARG